MSNQELKMKDSVFRTLEYMRQNQRCQEHLATLGLDLSNQSVLEVGSGVGDHTTYFTDRGCAVVSVEARLENCQFALDSFKNSGYQNEIDLKIIHCEVANIGERIEGLFDIVYCYGLLYHLADPENALKLMAGRCRGMLLLETCVSFGTGESINRIAEDKTALDQSFHGRGCRPTRPWVFNRLNEIFEYVYVPRTQPAHERFPIDWSCDPPPDVLTRAVFVASRHRLDNPALLDFLPEKQRYC